MAEAFLKKYDGNHFLVESAGLEPGAINPNVVTVMLEVGIDLSQKTPRLYSTSSARAVFSTPSLPSVTKPAPNVAPFSPAVSDASTGLSQILQLSPALLKRSCDGLEKSATKLTLK
jgi:hypothetical protein